MKLNQINYTSHKFDIIDIIFREVIEMANLLVRGLDEKTVQNLRDQAAAHGKSVEAEHRQILANALNRPIKKTFAEILMSMPNIGIDSDFKRVNDLGDKKDVFN